MVTIKVPTLTGRQTYMVKRFIVQTLFGIPWHVILAARGIDGFVVITLFLLWVILAVIDGSLRTLHEQQDRILDTLRAERVQRFKETMKAAEQEIKYRHNNRDNGLSPS